MNKRLSILCALLSAFCLSAAAVARANGGPHGGPMGGPGMFGDMMMGDGAGMMLPLILRHADLTADQQAQVHQIMEANRQQLHTLFDQLHTANNDLMNKLLAPGNVQAQDLAPQLQQITQLRQQLMQQGLNSALAIRAVLTPEQLGKVAQFKDQMQSLRSQMRALMGSH